MSDEEAKDAIKRVERAVRNPKSSKEDIDRAFKAVEKTGNKVAIRIAEHMIGERQHPPGPTE